MTEYTPVLTEIAQALSLIANSPNYVWISPIAILVSGILGWCASQHSINRQEKRKRLDKEAKKEFVFELLNHEITLRWNKEIQPYLRGLLKHEPLTAFKLFSSMELCGDDVFIFKSVSTSFSDYFFIENHQLVSQIIHGYLLVRDLIDYKSLVAHLLKEREVTYKSLRSSLPEKKVVQKLEKEYGKDMNTLWESFPAKLDAIDKRFSDILQEINYKGRANKAKSVDILRRRVIFDVRPGE